MIPCQNVKMYKCIIPPYLQHVIFSIYFSSENYRPEKASFNTETSNNRFLIVPKSSRVLKLMLTVLFWGISIFYLNTSDLYNVKNRNET